MNKNTKKTLLSVVVGVLVFTGLYFGFKTINKPKVTVGDKSITITITDHDEEAIYSEKLGTDVEILGQLLNEINEDKEIFIFEGSTDSEFGRFISEITLLELAEGEFWVYDSDNNAECNAAEFCPGVDMLAIQDGDAFSFNVLQP